MLLIFALTIEGNPLEEKHSAEGDWREQATKKLPKLKKLDGMTSCIYYFHLMHF